MHRGRFGRGLAALWLLPAVGLAACTGEATAPAGEPVAVPMAIPVAPPLAVDRRLAEVQAPPATSVDAPWTVRGIRLWEDTGLPCGEPLLVRFCQAAGESNGELQCLGRWSRWTRRYSPEVFREDPDSGSFEIVGMDPDVVFVGVQTQETVPSWENAFVRGRPGQAAVIPIAGGEKRALILWCQPRRDLGVRILEADGTEVDAPWFRVWWEGALRFPRNDSLNAQCVPVGWPVWVVAKVGGRGPALEKQVMVRPDAVNSLEFQMDRRPSVLSGQLVEKVDGFPLFNVGVFATRLGGHDHTFPNAMTRTDADGRYTLELVPGVWRIEFGEYAVAPGRIMAPGTWTLDVALAPRAAPDAPPQHLDPFPVADLRPYFESLLPPRFCPVVDGRFVCEP